MIYVPDAHASGDDSFEYMPTDCPGNLFRQGDPAQVSFTIIAINDAPIASPSRYVLDVDVASDVALRAIDHDGPDEEAALTYTLVRPPAHAVLRDGASGVALVAGSVVGSPVLSALSDVCGMDSFTFLANDTSGAPSNVATVTLEVDCPRTCSDDDMVYTLGPCDSITIRRTVTWSWDTSSDCDLPRASGLPATSEIECDYVGRRSRPAIVIYVFIAVFITAKLILLLYILANRREKVFTMSQPLFCTITILGGVIADITPVWLMGELTTERCMTFASWMLITVTLLYGPLVIKTYRVWKIFDNETMRKVRLSNAKLLAWLAGYLILEGAIIAAAFAASPVEAVEYKFSISDFAKIDRYKCSDANTFFPYVAYTLTVVPAIAALFLAYKTRNVQAEYTENRPILASLYTLSFAALVMIPITYIAISPSPSSSPPSPLSPPPPLPPGTSSAWATCS